MKLILSLLAVIGIPLLVLAEGTSPSNSTLPAPGAPAPAAQAIAEPSPTPTVDLKNAPKIVCLHPNFDFGTVDEDPDITHEFTIRNKGRRTLKITGVSTSCGCTAAVVGDKYPVSAEDKAKGVIAVIPPGGSEVVKATYHTKGRPGHATKIITVACDDPVNPNFQLKLDMTVARDVDVQPDRLYLYGIHFKQPHESSFVIKGKPDMPLSILSVESVNKVVTITSVTPFMDEKEKRMGVSVVVNLPVTQAIGGFADEIFVKTNNQKKPEVRVQVLGEVTGRVTFNPKSFTFMPNQEAPVTIQFNVDPPKGFEIRNVKSVKHLSRPFIKKTRGANGIDMYALVASVVKNLPKDSDGKDQIIVQTNDPDQEQIIFEVQAQK